MNTMDDTGRAERGLATMKFGREKLRIRVVPIAPVNSILEEVPQTGRVKNELWVLRVWSAWISCLDTKTPMRPCP